MKSYSTNVLNVFTLASHLNNQHIYPDDLAQLDEYKTTPRDTREGYLNKLVKAGLLDAPEDKRKALCYKLNAKGDWVVRMYAGGWIYSDGTWTGFNTTLDQVTVDQITRLGVVPTITERVQKLEGLQES
jgi:hypothetical protein